MSFKPDPKISYGNILNLVGMVILVGIAWGMNVARSENMQDQIDTLAVGLIQEKDARQGLQTGLDIRVRVLENSQTRLDERLNSILQILTRSEARLERIETQLQRQRETGSP